MADKPNNERFYWLKLKKDFFKRHDIKVIEGMENGKDYVLFYLKLLCESLDHNGNLRFSDTIPYSESMLASVTGTNIDVVRSAMKILVSLNLVEVLDDQTIFMREVEKLTGSESESAERVRRFRERQAQQALPSNADVTNCNGVVTQEYRDKSLENKSLDINIKENHSLSECQKKSVPSGTALRRFVKPTVEEIANYCAERGNNVDAQKFYDYYESNGWKVGRNSMKDWKAAVRTWERNGYDGGGAAKGESPNSESWMETLKKL